MRDVLNIALVGIAGYGEFYVEQLLRGNPEAPPVAVVGLVDIAPERCSKLEEIRRRGWPIYPTLEALYDATDVDLAIVSTPIPLHASQTCFALLHGSNVLCEKPIAGSLADAAQMQDVEEMTGRFVAVGFQWSFTSAIQGLKRDIMAGEFGRARRMRTIVHYPRGMGYFSRNSWVGKLRTPAGHSVLDSPANNATAHFLHNMLYLLGRQVDTSSMPKRVQAELFRANEIENYDTAAIRVLTDEDVEVLFYTSHCVRVRQEPLCQFEFEKAVVEFDGGNGAELVARFHDGRVKRYGKLVNTADKLWHSVQCVGDGTRPCCGIKAAMAHLRTIVAAQRPREEISTFRAELQERHPMGEEDRIICVDGLDTGLMECFQHGALPSERRLPWSTVDRRAITPVVQLPRSGRRLRASTR